MKNLLQILTKLSRIFTLPFDYILNIFVGILDIEDVFEINFSMHYTHTKLFKYPKFIFNKYQLIFVKSSIDSNSSKGVYLSIIDDSKFNLAFFDQYPILICNSKIYYLRFYFDLEKLLFKLKETLAESDLEIEEKGFPSELGYDNHPKILSKDFFNERQTFSLNEIRPPYNLLVDKCLEINSTQYTVPFPFDAESFAEIKLKYTKEKLLKDLETFYNKDILDLIANLRYWFNNKDIYNSRGVPYRRGLMLYGPPGTGKSTFALSYIKNLFNIPAYILDLNSANNQFLDNCLKFLERTNKRKIVMVEDFDRIIFKDKNSKNSNTNIDLSKFLYFIDNLPSTGTLFILTTNNLDQIDSTLATITPDGEIYRRPGRIDYVVKFDFINLEVKRKIAETILKGCGLDIIEEIIEKYKDEDKSLADFKEICWEKFVELDLNGEISYESIS